MSQEPKIKVYLIHADKQAVRFILNTRDEKKEARWVYLGKNVGECLEIEKKIGCLVKKTEIGNELQENAKKYREEYIDFIGKNVPDTDTFHWYLTSLSEKNPFVSDFFLNFCYMKTLLGRLREGNGTWYVLCESRYLIEALHKNLTGDSDSGILCIKTPSSGFVEGCLAYMNRIKNKTYFSVRYFFRILIAKLVRILWNKNSAPLRDRPVIVIHSWADGRSFAVPHSYNDVYFGNLGKKIVNSGENLLYLINTLPTFPYPSAVRNLVGIHAPWILLEECLRFSDIFRALSRGSARKCPIKNTVLSGLDVRDLINEEQARDRNGSRLEQSYLCYAAAQTICGWYSIRSFIYTFENHIWEKMFIIGLRKFCNKTKLIGYAATVNPMEFSYSCSRYEKEIIPLPDLILVNGMKTRASLADSGFEKDQIMISGSLRYEYLFEHEPLQKRTSDKKILVALSADYHRSVEMIVKCCAAFGNVVDLHVTLKLHPTADPASFSRFVSSLPSHFSFETGSIRNLFADADLVLYNDSIAAVEAAALGIPLLHIKSGFTLDINIFDSEPYVPSFSDPGMIRDYTRSVFLQRTEISSGLGDIVRSYFAPVDDSVVLQAIR